MVMLDAGVIQFFKKMDIGSLDIGDYLGIGLLSFFISMPFNFFIVLIY